jgi:copper resistance protein C
VPPPHRRPLGRRLLLGSAGGLAGAAAPRPTRAHALVTASDPAAGAALAAPPERVTVRFNSRIDHARSRLSLIGPGAAGAAPVVLAPLPPGDPTVLEAPCPPGLVPWAPGAWRLRWQVLAVDGHITRGDIPFALRPAPGTDGAAR